MTVEISVLIAGLGCAFAIYFGLKNNRRADVKEIKEQASMDTLINYKLDNIGSDVKAIKVDITETKDKVERLDRRVVVVEQSTKSAHKRLDDLTNNKKEERLDA